ncbi:hypothetical protein [Breznakiella homolactica]|uniref:Uncharacterized protein n=1 Tax=Breznakiella homolactica TaxID=2798577 RepID=A0A7T7XPX1_9SPIR|nr:hypothetical protein [Breznakiella homolactica]QQO10349.1 hypothetical protein JFL75_05370 [Breznakiella homolactica]
MEYFEKSSITDYRTRLLNSFPKELEIDVENVIKILPFDKNIVMGSNGINYIKNDLINDENINVAVNDEIINIPYRIYFNKVEDIGRLTKIQKTILNCIYSRHFNGYIRQENVEKLITESNYWVIPYFVQLFGEYIPEIYPIIDKHIDRNVSSYLKFINQNKKYWEMTTQRMTSYWSEFNRGKCYYYRKYIGKKIIGKMNRIRNCRHPNCT